MAFGKENESAWGKFVMKTWEFTTSALRFFKKNLFLLFTRSKTYSVLKMAIETREIYLPTIIKPFILQYE